ncbi:MAG: hypothetical protein JRE14_17305, partial [Deltaproteobacteria bacterium]|nr:hypothetical protein [Deltaproteobacteria bacterium]
RDELYRVFSESKPKERPAKSKPSVHVSTDYKSDFNNKLRQEFKEIIVEKIEQIGILRGIGNIQIKLGIARTTAEHILFELVEENILRVDRQKGSSRKTYTLTNSIDNKLIDSFVQTIQDKILWENRHIGIRQGWEVDALIETKKTNYLVETMIRTEDKLDSVDVEMKINLMKRKRGNLKLAEAVIVILIGISENLKINRNDIKELETDDVMIRYIDF